MRTHRRCTRERTRRLFIGGALCVGLLSLLSSALLACGAAPADEPSALAGPSVPPLPTASAPPAEAPTVLAEPRPTATAAASPRPAAPTPPPPPTAAPQTPAPTAASTASPDERTPAPTPAPPPAELRAKVGRVVTTRSVDGLQRPSEPADTFQAGERVYISVEFFDVLRDAVLGFRWDSNSSCTGSYETPPQSAARRGFYGFYVDNASCPGTYDVEITVDGATAATAAFTIRARS